MCPLVTPRTFLTVILVVMATVMSCLATPINDTLFEEGEFLLQDLEQNSTVISTEGMLSPLAERGEIGGRNCTRAAELAEFEIKLRQLYAVLTGGVRESLTEKNSSTIRYNMQRDPPVPTIQRVDQIEERQQERGSFDYLKSIRACPVTREWVRPNFAPDINETTVRVIQPPPGVQNGTQHFETVTCNFEETTRQGSSACPNCCVGIDTRQYFSQCRQRRALVRAYVVDLRTVHNSNPQPEWRWVLMNSACTCFISEK